MAEEKAIIIVKKKGGHGGHHGGAWKVAYADFVTAMMAFFMVMWLVNSAASPTRENIASYFRKPGIFEHGSGVPLMIGGAGILPDAFAPNLATQERKFTSGMQQVPMTKRSGEEDAIKKSQEKLRGESGKGVLEGGKSDSSGFGIKENSYRGKGKGSNPLALEQIKQQLASEIKKQLAGIPELSKLLGTVDIKVEADGINIEIMDSVKESMFEVGSSTINPLAKAAFLKIAEVIKPVPNSVDIIGHTDAKPFGRGFKGYTNWELSADRANSARRLMEEAGIPAERIGAVVGKADRELKVIENPNAEQNRRITMKIKFPKSLELNDPALLESQLSQQEEFEEEPAEPVHSMTAEEVLQRSREKSEQVIVLDPTPSAEGTEMPDSNLFGEFPIIKDLSGPPF
jgi:chemotaxis protein MotB